MGRKGEGQGGEEVEGGIWPTQKFGRGAHYAVAHTLVGSIVYSFAFSRLKRPCRPRSRAPTTECVGDCIDGNFIL